MGRPSPHPRSGRLRWIGGVFMVVLALLFGLLVYGLIREALVGRDTSSR